MCEIDLWTGCIAGGLPVDDWCAAIEGAGFEEVSVGLAVDAFGGSGGEHNARAFEVSAHVFLAQPPRHDRTGVDADAPAGLMRRMRSPIVDEGLGHSSYVVGLGDGSALVVDPARFPNRQRQVAARRGWRIAWTADTHSHADYISGSPELAADGATFLASAGAGLEVAHRPVVAGEDISVADDVVLRAIATPGHTPDHLAYLLLDGGEPVALFSGGSLMVGAVGRTDLLGDEQRDELARELFRALRAEILTLPDDLPVYPTHGAGSFCSAPAGASRTSTIGREVATNPMVGIDDEDLFVETLVAGLGSFPSYFRELPEINRRGPRLYPTIPALARLDLDTVRRHLADGAVLVDARPIDAYSQEHPAGAISIQHRPVFASWLGWLVALDQPVVFILDDTPTGSTSSANASPSVTRRSSASSTVASPPGPLRGYRPLDTARCTLERWRRQCSMSARTPSGPPGTSPGPSTSSSVS